ncbi:MAG TPA: hypothetical protein PLL09_00535 [Flavobacterium sp.]|uniref:hypothetical protein n=1 Tax=unclassified Flavobacterium TaxID=196869 RepID=UPI0025B92C93|nr:MULTISPECIES: hypothetical protein [unclassified Flavobacterium]HRE76286.1 hypothetical protein [Flavobacterium sp.]
MNTKLDTSKSASLPQPVVEQLHFLSKQQAVEAMFVSTIIGSNHPCIVVLLNSEANAVEWRTQKWVKKAFQNHGVTFLISNIDKRVSNGKKATLFLHHHTCPEKEIYRAATSQYQAIPFAKAKKRSKNRTKNYRLKQKFLRAEINKTDVEEGLVTVFNLYNSLYELHLTFLEELLFGTSYQTEDLHQRVLRVASYNKEIQRAFVKKSPTKFYLLETLIMAKTIDDLCMLEDHFVAAIQANETLLGKINKNLLNQLKKERKDKSKTPHPVSAKSIYDHPKVLEFITTHPNIEAIYEYKRVEQQQNQTICSIRFWLIVAEGISNHQLSNWHEAIKQQTQNTIEIIPVVHSRSWIQQNLYESQHFFQNAMTEENSIYQQNDALAQLHWHVPYTAHYPDLNFYSQGCQKLYKTLQHIRTLDGTQNKEGLGLIYTSFIVRTCQVIVYANWSYFPNQLPFAILWRLCEAAHTNNQHLQFLFQKLSFKWLTFITHHQNTFNPTHPIDEPDLQLLDQIATQLLQTLKTSKQEEQ